MPRFFSFLILPLIAFAIILYLISSKQDSSPTTGPSSIKDTIIVIDAGHGEEDPGKVGINGALEKDINLSIAKLLHALLEDKGFQVYLTRTDDSAPDSKREDMTKRAQFIEEKQPDFIISIHQNSYTDASIFGPQVFYYSSSPEGKAFADIMQQTINTFLNVTKPRSPQANNNYYLLKNAPSPMVIVECGFLSNPQDAALLITEGYQKQIAQGIYLGLLAYYESLFGPGNSPDSEIPSELIPATDAS